MNLIIVYALLVAGNAKLNAVKNTYLLYTDIYRSRYIGEQMSVSQFVKPYIFYTDSSGEYQDNFFDTFILADHFTYYDSKATSKKYWWNEYIHRVFGKDRSEIVALQYTALDDNRAFALQVRESCLYRLMDAVENSELQLSFSSKTLGTGSHNKAGYIGFRFFDVNEEEITGKVLGLHWSEYLGTWFRYFDVDSGWQRKTLRIEMPKGTAYVSTFIGSWLCENLVVDGISWKSGATSFYEDFERHTPIWRFAYLPKLAETDEYWGFVPIIDSILGYYSENSDRDLKLNIILTIPWSYQTGEENHFGAINDHGLDLSRKEEAVDAIMWFVEKCSASWEKVNPRNVRLLGFYWLNEEGNDFKYIDLGEIAERLHQRGYLLFGSCFNSLWAKMSFDSPYFLIFDHVWLQPNAWPPGYKSDDVYFQRVVLSHEIGGLEEDVDFVKRHGIPLSELSDIDEIADSLNAGIVIEWVPGQEEVLGYGRSIDYINVARTHAHDFFNKRVLVFDDRGFGQYCSRSSSPVFRKQYDEMYYFVKKNRELLD